MLDLLLNHLTVVTMDDDDRVLKNACIGVREGRIAFIGAGVPAEPAARTLDCTGKIAMPGLINTHAHAAMSLMRGYADDYVLQEWLNDHVFPIEAKLTPDDVYLGTQLTLAEMLATGTVSLTDMYMHLPQMARAVEDAGLYGNFSNAGMCF